MILRQKIKARIPARILEFYRWLRNERTRQSELASYYWQVVRRKAPYSRVTRKVHVLSLGEADGQWCIADQILGKNPTVMSFGIGTDISWDKAMVERFGATVYAFDPTPIALDWLKQQSVPEEIHVIPLGLADSDGCVDFSLPTNHGVSFVMKHVGPQKTSTSCEVRKFSSLIEMLKIPRVDVLKLDIEGAEYGVMNDILNAGIPIQQLLVEFHHRFYGAEGVGMTSDCIRKIQSRGFKLFYRSPRGLEFCFAKD